MSETTTTEVVEQPPVTATTAPAAPPPDAPPSERPAWLPEKFKTPEDLAKSYGELEGAFGRKADAFKAELQAQLREGVPEKPDGYELTVPEGLLPEGFTAQIDPADPFLAQMRETFHALGAKPEQFNAAAAAFLQWQVANMPDVAAEQAKLGEGAPERIAAVDRWLAKTLDATEYKAVANGLVTAEGIQAIEKLMRLATGGAPQRVPGGGESGALTPEAASQLLADPKYRDAGAEGQALRAKFKAFVASGGKLPGYGGGGFSR